MITFRTVDVSCIGTVIIHWEVFAQICSLFIVIWKERKKDRNKQQINKYFVRHKHNFTLRDRILVIVGPRDLALRQSVRGPTHALIQGVPGEVSTRLNRRKYGADHSPHLASGLRITAVVPSHPPYAFKAGTGKELPLPLLFNYIVRSSDCIASNCNIISD
jgi:hypothetical protein